MKDLEDKLPTEVITRTTRRDKYIVKSRGDQGNTYLTYNKDGTYVVHGSD